MSELTEWRKSLEDGLTEFLSKREKARESRDFYREKLKEAEYLYDTYDVHVTNMLKGLHDLDGREKDCEHEFEIEVSGRGVGFDEVCVECGWCKNLYPVC